MRYTNRHILYFTLLTSKQVVQVTSIYQWISKLTNRLLCFIPGVPRLAGSLSLPPMFQKRFFADKWNWPDRIHAIEPTVPRHWRELKELTQTSKITHGPHPILIHCRTTPQGRICSSYAGFPMPSNYQNYGMLQTARRCNDDKKLVSQPTTPLLPSVFWATYFSKLFQVQWVPSKKSLATAGSCHPKNSTKAASLKILSPCGTESRSLKTTT